MNKLTTLTLLTTTLLISCCNTHAMENDKSSELNKELKLADVPICKKRVNEILELTDDYLKNPKIFNEKTNSFPIHKKIKFYSKSPDSFVGYEIANQLAKTITNESLLKGWIETNSLENELQEVQHSPHLKKLIINHALAPYFIKPKETLSVGVCRFPRFSSEGNYIVGLMACDIKEDEGSNFFCWNLQNKEENKTVNQVVALNDFEQHIFAIDFNEKTGQLIVGGIQGLVHFYSNFDGKNAPVCQISKYTHSEDEIWSAQLSEDGTLALTCGEDATMRLWNTKTGKEIWCVKNKEEIAFTNGVFSKNGQQIIVGSNDNKIYRVNTQTGKEEAFEEHEDVVGAVAISPDEKRYATGSDDRTAQLWNSKNNELIAILNFHKHEISSATFDEQSRYLATGDQGGMVCLWDAGDGKHLQTIELNNDCVHDIKFLSEEMAICSKDNSFNVRVSKYDVEPLVAASKSINAETIELKDLLLMLADLQNKSKTIRPNLHKMYCYLHEQYTKAAAEKNK